jgi:hypothetical protein
MFDITMTENKETKSDLCPALLALEEQAGISAALIMYHYFCTYGMNSLCPLMCCAIFISVSQ